jgi:hypothetical protein
VVLCNPFTVVVSIAEVTLGPGMPLLGGFAKPLRGLSEVLIDSFAVAI